MPDNPRPVFCTVCTVLVILACVAAGCSSGPAPSSPEATPASGEGNMITIRNFAFDPPALTVKTGTAVTWENSDSPPHAIASDAGSPVAFSSDSFTTGTSYTFTFTRPGTYPYHCSLHPSMKGTIIVL